jgi:D-alanyl-lipoteichoic acid acyltransferase DltB (MBOAT superfamily)
VLFNSLTYIAFLSGIVVGFFIVPSRWRWIYLLAASYGFYASWRAEYALLLAGSTLLHYLCGLRIEAGSSERVRRFWLVIGLAGSLGTLFVFKYLAFFARTLGMPLTLRLVLPVGISFYTFQSIGYTIDVYWKRRPAERHVGVFALFVAFFPLLLAGPIERSTRFLPQLRQVQSFSYEGAMLGVREILWGLFLKMAVADNLGRFVDAVYHDVGAYRGMPLITATVFFALQVYADFCGYSNVAVGSGRLMGFDLIRNFDAPYLATSLPDFWRRWHISLYSWLSDYLFGPLASALRSQPFLAVPIAAIVTFTLSGLWHGAAWTFVVWGALHGFALAALAVTRGPRRRLLRLLPVRVEAVLGWALTFAFVCLACVFFRASSLAQALQVLALARRIDFAHLVGVPVVSRVSFVLYLSLCVAVLAADAAWRSTRKKAFRLGGVANVSVLTGLLVALYVLGVFEEQKFIYFQF